MQKTDMQTGEVSQPKIAEVAPAARGLFSGAISQSGGFTDWVSKNRSNAQSVLDNLSTLSGCRDLHCLRSIASSDLIVLSERVTVVSRTGVGKVNAVVDCPALKKNSHSPFIIVMLHSA